MANQQHVELLQQGSEFWYAWRIQHPEVKPNLSEADLGGADLTGADLSRAHLWGAHLTRAHLSEADLSRAHLDGANLSRADLTGANLYKAQLSDAHLVGARLGGAHLTEAILSGAHLRGAFLYRASLYKAYLRKADFTRANLTGADLWGADLRGAHLAEADLSEANLTRAHFGGAHLAEADLSEANLTRAILGGADLTGADLRRAILVDTNLTDAILTQCNIYGVSAWNVQLEGAKQESLVITDKNEPTITVDNLKVAQFIYLLLTNNEIREVIDTITSKVVLILGRFTQERKQVLDALREELRKRNYLPVLFDFEKPARRDITETISTLAHLSRFVIADLTDAKSIPQELMAFVPSLPSLAIQPLILTSQREYGMFEHFTRFPWVLPIYHYTDQESLLQSLKENIIEPAEQKVKELAQH